MVEFFTLCNRRTAAGECIMRCGLFLDMSIFSLAKAHDYGAAVTPAV